MIQRFQTNGKRNKAKLIGHSCKVGVQLIFSSHRRYRLSVAVRWYFLVRLWVKLFVSKGCIQVFLACLMDIGWFATIYIPCFYWKTSTWSKDNKDGNPFPHKCCLIIALWSLGIKHLVWLWNKYITINMAGPRTISECFASQ